MRGAPIRLRCEYLENPLGIDEQRPRLSWWVNDPRPAEIQTAYQIQAALSLEALHAAVAELWDSGHVASRQTCNIVYAGLPPAPGQRVWWRVRCYDSDGVPSPWSDPAWFELGLPAAADWRAQWIGAALTGSATTAVPAAVLGRSFELREAVHSARLYVAALGACRVEINGRRVGTAPLQSDWSDFAREVAYSTYDVTPLLAPGANRIGVLLGDGYYCGHLGAGQRQQFGDRPLLCAQLVVRFAGGAVRVIGTDPAWQWRPSWVLSSDPSRGESVDGRQRIPGWSRPEPPGQWYPVEVAGVAPRRRARARPPLVVLGEHAPVADPIRRPAATPARYQPAEPRWLFDFGRTLMGRLRVSLQAPAGVAVRVRYALAAERNGELSEVHSEDCYSTAGAAEGETFEAQLVLHAFRYVEVTGALERDALGAVVAIAVGARSADSAEFSCDHELLQRFYDTSRAAVRHALLEVPLAGLAPADRVPKVADVGAVVRGAACHQETAALFSRWIEALIVAQRADGGLPAVVPPIPASTARAGPGAVDALVVATWSLYRWYGDRRLLEAAYPAVQRFLNGLRAQFPDGLRRDGAADESPADPLQSELIGTAWYCYSLSLAARMAGVLGRLPDLETFAAGAAHVRDLFRRRFVSADGLLVGDSLGGYLLALQFGLLEGAERPQALARMAHKLRSAGFHPDIDLRDGGLLLEVLTREGRSDLACQVLLQTSAPSWLHPLLGGASALVDECRGEIGRLAMASVVEWLICMLAGLALDSDLTLEHNAFRSMRIRPYPPLGPGFAAGAPLSRVRAALDTVHGRYESAWQIDSETFELRVRVPCNCSARVILPDRSEHDVVAGEHHFSMTFAQATDGIPVLREISEAS
ncbi:MAG: family 78 glycoside hydrolase catalytic domain [Pseudomonadales bacterium]